MIQPEVATALMALVRLALGATSTGQDAGGTVAEAVLQHLVAACTGQRGALVLTTARGAAPFRSAVTPGSSADHASHAGHQDSQTRSDGQRGGSIIRTLAVHRMREEEARMLVVAALASVAGDREVADGPAWLTCALPIDEYLAAHGRPAWSTGPEASPTYALLLLGWKAGSEAEAQRAAAQASLRLPLLADAATGAIVSALLAESGRSLAATTEWHETDRLKAELLATVSHELRSPLAAIKGYAGTLLRHERRLPREERHEFLQAISEASDRLEVIIDRLLLMSQLETGAIAIQRAPIDAARIAGEALESTERRVAQPVPGRFTFTLRLENAGGMPARTVPLVAADPRWLQEVLDNLLENAVKYSPEGGTIEVALRPTTRAVAADASPLLRSEEPRMADGLAAGASLAVAAAEGEQRPVLEILVRDSGRGIPSEHLGQIFDRFHRVDTRLTRDVDGLGLGLAICQRIVELHQGAIWAESVSGQGSTFHVLLPLDREDETSPPGEER
jgi:signal transduction histidine kinase